MPSHDTVPIHLRWYVATSDGVECIDGDKLPPLVKADPARPTRTDSPLPVGESRHQGSPPDGIDHLSFSLELATQLGAAHALGEGPDVPMNPEWVAITIGDGWVAAALGADWCRVSQGMHPILDSILTGFLPDWSPIHRDNDLTYLDRQVDGSLRPYLERIHAAGYETASSCQGGYVPIATKALEKWRGHSHDWVPLVTIQDKVWGKKQAHLFVTTGWGHGCGGVATGEAEMRKCAPDAHVVDRAIEIRDRFKGVKGVHAQIASDETLSYCILESDLLTDTEAKEWWGTVTQVLCR